jgi:hypothetical protein
VVSDAIDFGRPKLMKPTLRSPLGDGEKKTPGRRPNVGTAKKRLRDVFPTLGRRKKDFGTFSQRWDGEKKTSGRFPNVGTRLNIVPTYKEHTVACMRVVGGGFVSLIAVSLN